jgi:predicted RNA binding protein YcfA (HicA-like mRNA interferase family)
MRAKSIYAELAANGWQFHRQGRGRHEVFRHPSGAQMVVSIAGRSGDLTHHVKRALLADIRRAAA